MKKTHTEVIARIMIAGAIGTYSCAPSSQSEMRKSLGAPSGQASGAQARSGVAKAPGVTTDTLGSSGQQSSLDALRQGSPPVSDRQSGVKEIYFEFDRYDLDAEDRATLRANAEWLKKNPAVRLEIEGHSDERGTTEYNLALGAKRAQAAKDYLMSLGIAAQRISTISYGEEIPACRGQGEDCWRQNRRDRFVIVGTRPTS